MRRHELDLISLVFGLAFVAVGVWLVGGDPARGSIGLGWAGPAVMIGLAALVATAAATRPRPRPEPAEAGGTETTTVVTPTAVAPAADPTEGGRPPARATLESANPVEPERSSEPAGDDA